MQGCLGAQPSQESTAIDESSGPQTTHAVAPARDFQEESGCLSRRDILCKGGLTEESESFREVTRPNREDQCFIHIFLNSNFISPSGLSPMCWTTTLTSPGTFLHSTLN